MGNNVWYNCPKCGEEKWAKEAFVGSVCFKCMGLQQYADNANKAMRKEDPDFFKRRERFITLPNGKALHPKSTYKYSNFRTLYKQICINDITDNDILDILSSEIPSLVNIYKSSSFSSIHEKCVQLWTAESPLYHKFKNMLIYDDYNNLKKFMPIICGIHSCIIKPTNEYIETYRGSKIFMTQFDKINVGATYRISQMLATSENKCTAQGFLAGDGVLVKFKIPKGCYNASRIDKYSLFNEEEVLFPAYTAIKITYKSKASKLIECEVIKNSEMMNENAESRVL